VTYFLTLPRNYNASAIPLHKRYSFKIYRDIFLRKDAARKALQWFRGQDYDVDDELTKMMDALKEAEENKGTLGDLMSSRGTVMALIVALGIMTFQQMSGVNAVIFYSGKIFETSGSSLSATAASIVIGVVQVHTV
jgi:SP family facilitated glucose transporter-like MFS transporter 8